MGLWGQAAEETRSEGLFHSSFFHWLLPVSTDIVVVHDAKLAKEVLSRENWAVFRKGRSYRLAADLIGAHSLLSAPDSDLWRWQRRLTSAAFRRGLLESSLVPSVHEAVEALCSRWEEQAAAAKGERPVVDFHKDSLALAIDVLGKFAFGFNFGSSSSPSGQGGEAAARPLNAAFECVLYRMMKFGRNPLLFATRRLPTKQNRAYWQSLRTIDEAVRATIECRLAQGVSGEDLLGQLLGAAAEEDGQMDHGLILQNLKTFLFAGHDTTASTLSWALYLLATHPAEEAAVLEEFRSLPSGGLPSAESLEALPHLDAVVRETLRLYAPAGFTREPLQDVDIGGFCIPKGAEVFIFPYLTHRDPRLFAEPEKFVPRRWLAGAGGELGQRAPESMGWMPFSLGARNCVGSQVAKLEIKAALHALLTRYAFAAAPDDGHGPPAVALYMTLVPNAVRLIPRPR